MQDRNLNPAVDGSHVSTIGRLRFLGAYFGIVVFVWIYEKTVDSLNLNQDIRRLALVPAILVGLPLQYEVTKRRMLDIDRTTSKSKIIIFLILSGIPLINIYPLLVLTLKSSDPTLLRKR